MDDMEPLDAWGKEDWAVFAGVSVALGAVLVFVIWLNVQSRGELGHSCLPDATCRHPTLVCRQEQGDWRCLPPRSKP